MGSADTAVETRLAATSERVTLVGGTPSADGLRAYWRFTEGGSACVVRADTAASAQDPGRGARALRRSAGRHGADGPPRAARRRADGGHLHHARDGRRADATGGGGGLGGPLVHRHRHRRSLGGDAMDDLEEIILAAPSDPRVGALRRSLEHHCRTNSGHELLWRLRRSPGGSSSRGRGDPRARAPARPRARAARGAVRRSGERPWPGVLDDWLDAEDDVSCFAQFARRALLAQCGRDRDAAKRHPRVLERWTTPGAPKTRWRTW